MKRIIWGWACLEADFLRFYNIEIMEAVFIDKISLRRFLVLIRGLPADSMWQWFITEGDGKVNKNTIKY